MADGWAVKRIRKEWADFCRRPSVPEISACLYENNLYHWQAKISGPMDTPYEGGVFSLDIVVPPEYPFQPPKITFLTRIYHPNVDEKGTVSFSVRGEWFLVMTIEKLLISIQSMLSDPLMEEPLMPEIARIYQTDRALFESHAREWTAMYANGNSKPLQFLCRLAIRRQLLQAQPALMEDERGRREIADGLAGLLPVRLIDYIVN